MRLCGYGLAVACAAPRTRAERPQSALGSRVRFVPRVLASLVFMADRSRGTRFPRCYRSTWQQRLATHLSAVFAQIQQLGPDQTAIITQNGKRAAQAMFATVLAVTNRRETSG